MFLNARVLIEGLRHAGARVQRETLVTALETMGERRFADGLTVLYGPTDREGSAYVGLTIVGASQRFLE